MSLCVRVRRLNFVKAVALINIWQIWNRDGNLCTNVHSICGYWLQLPDTCTLCALSQRSEQCTSPPGTTQTLHIPKMTFSRVRCLPLTSHYISNVIKLILNCLKLTEQIKSLNLFCKFYLHVVLLTKMYCILEVFPLYDFIRLLNPALFTYCTCLLACCLLPPR